MTRVHDTAAEFAVLSLQIPNSLHEPLHALAQNGYTIVPDFLPHEVTSALLAECQDLYHQGKTHTAGIGRGSRHRVLSAVRNDQVVWLDSTHLSPAQAIYWQAMEDLRQQLNRTYFLGLVDYECHYAHYPVGGYYQKHRDTFHATNRRRISSVFYMNFDWTPANGGQLRLFIPQGSDDATVDVLPTAGTLVIFDSHMQHEVLPTQAMRHSLAGWLRCLEHVF